MRFVLTLAVLAVAPSQVLADRALSPTDGLGDWALETTLQIHGRGGDRVLLSDGRTRTAELEESAFDMEIRAWPRQGLYVGALLPHSVIESADSYGGKQRGFGDLELSSGYKGRLTPSFVTGGGLAVTLPTGHDVHSRERYDADLHGLIGFSFTPRWDFFFMPRAGFRQGTETDPLSGARVGFDAGFAYQRPRFFLMGYGFNAHHFEDETYLRSGGGYEIGWEGWPGVTFSFAQDFSATTGRGDGLSSMQLWLKMTVVYYPGERENILRKPDPRRGSDWMWWNPNQPTSN